MQLGVFSKCFEGDLETIFCKMNALGLYHTQFNLSSAGMETLPEYIEEEKIELINNTTKKFGITIDALSGTFNMIDPILCHRTDGIRRFQVLCEIAALLEIPMITLCTGSKNPQSKWMWDQQNLTGEAWKDLIETTEQILRFAAPRGIILGVETEASNIINTPQRAREYLDYFHHRNLKIIMDGANLFRHTESRDMDDVLQEAFEVLGQDIALAHAKDMIISKDLNFVAAGEGVLNYNTYIKLLRSYDYHGALIMHGLSEEQIPGSMEFLKGKL